MKRRWFLTGLVLPVIVAGCRGAGGSPAENEGVETIDGGRVRVTRNNRTLVMATTANYPPYEERLEISAPAGREDELEIVGFDIDLARLIAERMERELTIVDLEFGALIPAVMNDEVDIAMAALEPSRRRKQQVDFSDVYYRARHALISLDGYLRSRDLAYQTIGVLANSVQARYADTTDGLGNLDVIPYRTLDEVFEALDIGAIEGAFVEANVADRYLRQYPNFEAQIMPSDGPTGSAIALAKNSPLRDQINRAIAEIKASGEMDRLINQWFG